MPVVTPLEPIAPASTLPAIKTRSHGAVYRPELDILRFCSFFAVFCLHTMVYPVSYLTDHHIPAWLAKSYVALMTAGGFGVDLFFLLSAYLITDLLLREKSRFGTLDVKAFYIRRALRIWPLYFAFIGIVLLFPVLDFDRGQAFTKPYLAAFVLLSGNWACTVWGWPISVLAPLWSVSVEEQFYLLWPPIVKKLSRHNIVVASILLIVVANVFRIYELAVYHHSAMKMWGNTVAHLDSLAAGILIAALLNGRSVSLGWITRGTMAVSGVVLLAFRSHLIARAESPQSLSAAAAYPLVMLACSLILIAFLSANLNSVSLSYLGKISYGLYAYHMMALHLSDLALVNVKAGGVHAMLRVIMGFVLTIGLAALSYRFLEKPFLRFKEKFTRVKSRPA